MKRIKGLFRAAMLGGTLALGMAAGTAAAQEAAPPDNLAPAEEPARPRQILSDFLRKLDILPPLPGASNPAMNATVWAAASQSPLPPDLLSLLAQAESSFDPNATPGTSSACGLTQMIGEVLLQKAYEYGTRYGYAELREHIDRTTEIRKGEYILHYKAKSDDDKAALQAICRDPYFGMVMGAEHMRDAINGLQEHLHRPVTYSEAYFGYVFGPNGGAHIIDALHNRRFQRSPATAFIGKDSIKTNLSLLFRDAKHRRNPLSLTQLAAVFSRKMTDKPLPMIEERHKPAPSI